MLVGFGDFVKDFTENAHTEVYFDVDLVQDELACYLELDRIGFVWDSYKLELGESEIGPFEGVERLYFLEVDVV